MHEKLIDIAKTRPNIILDIRYSGINNFTKTPIYKKSGCFLNAEAANLLHNAEKLANEIGLRIKIFDAFRPHDAQWKLWNHTPDPNFISDPRTGSMPHCRGAAVDLTLTYNNGEELDMGTDFDTFSSLSHHSNTEISHQSQINRFILLGIMTAAGWDNFRNEWWHYQLFDPKRYPILNDKDAHTDMM